jgi:ABC-type nitrate/sulfonate/bicarbonate transport system substrate-binding protein
MRTVLLACLLVVVLMGCGSGTSQRDATLVLDFTPNAVHAGVYSATARGFDRRHAVRLRIVVPSATTDSIKLLESGRTTFAILDIHDLAIARERGADVVGIMAIVQRPLAAVVAAPQVRTPRQLQSATIGITGVPSDTAVLRSVVAGAGGSTRGLKTVTIGFNAVADLLARRVSAATAFWSDEGVTLAHRRPGFHSFRVDDYGAPSYPELVVCATATTLRSNRALAVNLVRALQQGYRFTISDPRDSAADLESRVQGLDPTLVSEQLTALLPAFQSPDGRVGELSLSRLHAWSLWEARFGIVSSPPDVTATFDPSAAQ